MLGSVERGLAAAACLSMALAWPVAPILACGMGGSSQGGSSGGGDNSGGGNSGGGNGGGGSDSGNGGSSRGGDSEAGNSNRQGADDAARSGLGDDGGSGPRRSRSGGDDGGGGNLGGLIGAVGNAINAADADRCNSLRAKLAAVQARSTGAQTATRVRAFVDMAPLLTGPALQQRIVEMQGQLHYWIQLQEEGNEARVRRGEPPLPVRRSDPVLDYLIAIQTMKALDGLGADEVNRQGNRAVAYFQNAANEAEQKKQQEIADLQSQIANAGCR